MRRIIDIFKRLFRIGSAEANSLVDKLEDPIKMTEQGIRDLKTNLNSGLQALAEVKAMSIRAKSDGEADAEKAADYEKKAVLLLKKAERGDLDQAEADKLASECLVQKESAEAAAEIHKKDQVNFEAHVTKLGGNIDGLKNNIKKFENELSTLKARAKVSTATKEINKQLADVDSSSTVSMLERMKDKVAEEEALAQSYAEIAGESTSVDDEINKALESGTIEQKAAGSLADLKAKMGLN